MQYIDNTAIEAVNNDWDTPDAFYHKTKLIATSKYISTSGWRGYYQLIAEPGYKIIEDDWVTGNWSDAPEGNSESDVKAKIDKLEKQYGDVYIIFLPTSNVFSTSYYILVRDKTTPELKGKTVGHKTKLFTEPDGSYRVRYHATDVVRYDAKTGIYTLNNGGWVTKTTHRRMNEYLPSGSWVHAKNYKTVVEGNNSKVIIENTI